MWQFVSAMSNSKLLGQPIPPEEPPKFPKVANLQPVLEEGPLHSTYQVQRLFSQPQFGHLSFPDNINVHCDNEKCNGVRRHAHGEVTKFGMERIFYHFTFYMCANCKASIKVFALKSERQEEQTVPGLCTKIYQEPAFGRPIPKRLYQVIGEANREHFLNARRSIARGLGIGSYAYYRRIIENNKFALVSAVLKVAQETNATASQIALLQEAQSEPQFSKAMDLLKEVAAVPPILLIKGHNPLALLHDLFSEGLHQLSDTECLERAQQAEIILCEVADRMQLALTENKALTEALTGIINRKKLEPVAVPSA